MQSFPHIPRISGPSGSALGISRDRSLPSLCAAAHNDGLGEGFEQRPVQTGDGELYVSLWHSGDDYYVLPEDEFQARVLEQTVDGQAFGGMGGMA